MVASASLPLGADIVSAPRQGYVTLGGSTAINLPFVMHSILYHPLPFPLIQVYGNSAIFWDPVLHAVTQGHLTHQYLQQQKN